MDVSAGTLRGLCGLAVRCIYCTGPLALESSTQCDICGNIDSGTCAHCSPQVAFVKSFEAVYCFLPLMVKVLFIGQVSRVAWLGSLASGAGLCCGVACGLLLAPPPCCRLHCRRCCCAPAVTTACCLALCSLSCSLPSAAFLPLFRAAGRRSVQVLHWRQPRLHPLAHFRQGG